MSKSLPARADVVIIGGGIVGCSIAYHLTKEGITNVVVLERKQLTSGTTWHAAGLVGQLRATRNLTELAKYTTTLFEGLEKETGQATGFKQNGSISIALTDGRLEELMRGASMAKSFGLDVQVISTAEIKERLPHYNMENVKGGVFLPKDGQVNPIDVTQALAAGRALARRQGVRERQGHPRAGEERQRLWRRDDRRHDPGRQGGGGVRHVVARSRPLHRRQHSAPCLRAFLHRVGAHRANCRATCRWCACPTNAPTTRRMRAS